MSTVTTSSSARVWTVVGLLVGAIGLIAQKIAGVTMPAVPPGLIFLIVAAGLMLNPRWKWAAIIAVLAGLAEVAGFFGSGGVSNLTAEFGVLASSWIRLLGIVTAVVAGALATKAAYRKAPAATAEA